MSDVEIPYRLPISVLRVSGTVTEVTNELAEPEAREKKSRSSTSTLDVRADSGGVHTLTIDAASWARLKTTINLLPDGRMTGASGDFTNKSASRWSGAVSAASLTAGALGPLLVPFGAPGVLVTAAAAVAAGGVAAGMRRELLFEVPSLTEATGQREPEPEPERPGMKDLGIEDSYGRSHPHEAELLAKYRWSLELLQARHAHVAVLTQLTAAAQARELKELDQSIRSVRTAASRPELAYAEWLKSKVHTAETRYDEEFRIDELPTTEGLDRRLETPPDPGDDRWWDLARRLHAAVTCDYAPEHAVHDETLIDVEPGEVLYRQPRFATLTTWKLIPGDTRPTRWERELDSIQRALVAAPGTAHKVRLVTPGGDDRSMTVSFDASGALTQVTSDSTDARVARAESLAALPAAAKDAFAAGGALAAPFVPKTALQGAKDDLDLAETQKKLNDLRHPAPADPLADLRDHVTTAELNARLAAAEHTIHDPSAAQFNITVTD